jgi:hypothetical protein
MVGFPHCWQVSFIPAAAEFTTNDVAQLSQRKKMSFKAGDSGAVPNMDPACMTIEEKSRVIPQRAERMLGASVALAPLGAQIFSCQNDSFSDWCYALENGLTSDGEALRIKT